jgi:hypothetical protein
MTELLVPKKRHAVDLSTWDHRKGFWLYREIKVPSAWSDGSIKITVNQGSFQAGETAYLFVVDSDGNVNPTGFPIVIGKRYGNAQSAVALLVLSGD